MNSVLEEILDDGVTKTLDGEIQKVKGQISIEEGKLIQRCIREADAEVSVEVGLAFGTSALFICEALKKSPGTKHYIIDPYQMYKESYGGIGLNNLKKSGFSDIIEFIEKPSHQGLVQLEQKNVKADFAFIDGWHTFDYALVDFFLIDKILKTGGIIIIDDTDWPALKKLSSFVEKNLSYKFIGGSVQRSHLKKNNTFKNQFRKIKNLVFGQDGNESKLFGAMAFRKISDDKRNWDHYSEF